MWLVSKLNKGCLLQYHSQSESCGGRSLLWPHLQLINCQGHWGAKIKKKMISFIEKCYTILLNCHYNRSKACAHAKIITKL